MSERVLVGLSMRDAADVPRLAALASSIGARPAVLQGEGVSLVAVLTELADAGAGQIHLVATTEDPLAPASSWLRRVAAHWWRERVDPPRLTLAPGVHRGEDADELAALTARPGRVVTGEEAPLRSTAWECPPDHEVHVLVCRGPRCSAQGADEVWAILREETRAAGLQDETVLAAGAGCLYPCNQAPVVREWRERGEPRHSWHYGVTPEGVRTLVRGWGELRRS